MPQLSYARTFLRNRSTTAQQKPRSQTTTETWLGRYPAGLLPTHPRSTWRTQAASARQVWPGLDRNPRLGDHGKGRPRRMGGWAAANLPLNSPP